MGLTKNYLRYQHESTFGVVAASQTGSSIKYLRLRNSKDRIVAVPAGEYVYFWDLKTKQIVNKLDYHADNASEVTVIECHHGGHARTNLIAVGYANGHVRLFEYETGMLKSTFTGHRTPISALAFDRTGSRLASGGKDCSIVLWDVVGERGLFSLKGHKNSISKLAFLYNEEHQRDLLISSSVDAVSTIKFWDLQLQHCFFTLPGHSNGVWSFVLIKNGTRLITGSTGPELKVYSILFLTDGGTTNLPKASMYDEDGVEVGSPEVEYGLQVRYLGNILRNSTAISNRVQDIFVDPSENLIVCHSIDKNVEFYSIRSDEEALNYAKKQTKKAIKRQMKRKRDEEGDVETVDDGSEVLESNLTKPVNSLDDLEPQRLVDCEINRKLGFERLPEKIRSADVIRTIRKDRSQCYMLAVITSSNRIDQFMFDLEKESKEDRLQLLASVDNPGHRTDVRNVSISSDNSLILSTSAESAKLWRLESRLCLMTVELDHGACCAFVNAQHIDGANFKNRFAVVATMKGYLNLLDLAQGEIIQTISVCDNDKPLTSIYPLPDRTGLVCASEDGHVRFYTYLWKTMKDENNQELTILNLEEGRILQFQEGVTGVIVSSDNRFLAVSLLDSTVRIHFLDTFKYFLTLYGHKFPVTTMDISSDNTLLVTGSPDKNIKIWGLDFGDCHKSIFAHEDAITCVRFVPKTHQIFSCGRDKQIKQWDCDHFIKIQTLRKHMGEVWNIAVSPNGKYIVSASHDKSLRLYRKTEEILVPSEEEEVERELEDERNVFEKQENIILGNTNLETGLAAKMTIDTVKSTDRLIEAIEVFLIEQDKQLEYLKRCELADARGEKRPAEPEKDPLLMTVMTSDHSRFILEVIRRIKPSELEEILITLPFDYVRKLITITLDLLKKGWDVELLVRCSTFLLRVNFGQVSSCPDLSPKIHELKKVILDRTYILRDCAGFNLMALEHLKQQRQYSSTKVT